jgi:hypothetical protein
MKIAIGINSFKQEADLEKRETLCLESLRRCRDKNPDVTLYNVIHDQDDIAFDGFKTLKLQQDGRYPYVNKIIDELAKTDNELIVFLNNDIVLNASFFKQIEKDVESYPTSRVHLHSLDSLNEDLKLQSYSVHGFDLFAFKKSWWLTNNHLFPDMYLGKPYWDTVYFIKSVLNSNFKILNKQPPVIFHPEHSSESMEGNDRYKTHNEKIASTTPEMGKWWHFVQNVLLKRPSAGEVLWWTPLANEIEIENQLFRHEN